MFTQQLKGRNKLVSMAILSIGIAIFILRFISMQPYLFTDYPISQVLSDGFEVSCMTAEEYEKWGEAYSLIEAICWVMAFIGLYLSTYLYESRIQKIARIIFSVIYWTTIMNLLDETVFDNTIFQMDEYWFLIIIILHGIYQYINVKRKNT